MSTNTDFDPYLAWLRIPVSEQPPNHYRLLGLTPFEQDRDEIRRRADERVRQIEGFRRSANGKYCEEVLYRISIAKAILLNPSMKTAYDQKLQAEGVGKAEPRQGDSSKGASQKQERVKAATLPEKPRRTTPDETFSSASTYRPAASSSGSAGRVNQPSAAKSKSVDDEIAEIESLLAPVPEDEASEDDLSKIAAGKANNPIGDILGSSSAGGGAKDDLDMTLDESIFGDLEDLEPLTDTLATSADRSTPKGLAPKGDSPKAAKAPKDDLDLILDDAMFGGADDSGLAADEAAAIPAEDPGRKSAAPGGGNPSKSAQAKADPAAKGAKDAGNSKKKAGKMVPRRAKPLQQEGSVPSGSRKPGGNRGKQTGLRIPADAGYEVLPDEDGLEAAGADATDPTLQLVAADSGNGRAEKAQKPSGKAQAPRQKASSQKAPADDTSQKTKTKTKKSSPRPNARRKMTLGLIVAGCLLAVGVYMARDRVFGISSTQQSPAVVSKQQGLRPRPKVPDALVPKPGPAESTAAKPGAAEPGSDPAEAAARPVQIGIAYGTEKKRWLQWATEEFTKTKEGELIRVNLIPMGSLESAHAIVSGDDRIHVWSPASGLYRTAFVRDWSAKYGNNPIIKEERLALTPLVVVMWKNRYDAFVAKAHEINFKNLKYAMYATHGWETIAGRLDWGRFKLAHTHPNQSNSGLMTLALIAYEYYGRRSGLTVEELMSPEFQTHIAQFATGVTEVPHSTGTLMRDMVLMGPSRYDALIVYESLAIEYLAKAEGRWGKLQVVYPKYNLWSDHPYCILDTPWSSKEQKVAAEKFLQFLLSEPIQVRALEHGFRPGNPAVPVLGPNSPFKEYAESGLMVELPEICEVPSLEVIENLQLSWIRSRPLK